MEQDISILVQKFQNEKYRGLLILTFKTTPSTCSIFSMSNPLIQLGFFETCIFKTARLTHSSEEK